MDFTSQGRWSWGLSVIAALFVLVLQVAAPALADVPAPHVAKAKADKCVEDTGFMRRSHMEVLKHQRDDTMRLGIRTTKHSLKDCVTCHAIEKDGKPVSIADPQHFCRSCHAYAAVKPDCFQCHSSVPEPAGQASAAK